MIMHAYYLNEKEKEKNEILKMECRLLLLL